MKQKNNILMYVILSVSLVIITFVFFLLHRFREHDLNENKNRITQEFIVLFNNILTIRHWAALHGGVYVRKTSELKPNPYLEENSERMADGSIMIRINPAWMTRLIFELSNQEKNLSYKLKITSLNPVNPGNAPDELEAFALKYFNQNKDQKYYYRFPENPEESIHFVGVLKTEKACLTCHETEKIGDIRGGIHITIPSETYLENVRDIKFKNFLMYLVFTLFSSAILILMLFYFREEKRSADLYKKFNAGLKQKVKAKTKRIRVLFMRESYLREIMKTVGEINRLMISVSSAEEFLQKTCDTLGAFRHYSLVWIGFRKGSKIEVRHKSDDHTQYLSQTFEVSCDISNPGSKGPAGRSILENQTVIVNNTQEDPLFLPWKKRAHESGFAGVIGIPIRPSMNGQPTGTILVYTSRKDGFDSEEITMLEELAGDIGFAVNSFNQKERLNSLQDEKIRNYEETVLSFVNLIEERDSYTAGHSFRVAEYCQRIAEQMNLPEDKIQLLKKAAILHDIGKVATPDAILLNPGMLSSLEFDLIKMHVETGYKILSNIKMYSGLAEIIKFHHERHDGQGYPAGAKGEEIPLLSRIMCVADSFD
ncbi:MAG: HD domain-containing protein, partial [Spirochaetia bacterium]|nr:HD domain-containing protein [Spirochaetia bacterium]